MNNECFVLAVEFFSDIGLEQILIFLTLEEVLENFYFAEDMMFEDFTCGVRRMEIYKLHESELAVKQFIKSQLNVIESASAIHIDKEDLTKLKNKFNAKLIKKF